MPRNDGGGRSRSEISSSAEQRIQDYREKVESLTDVKDDVLEERDAIAGMAALGTIEGVEAVTDSLHEAEETSQGEFSEGSDALTESMTEGQELEEDLQERAEADEADATKFGDAGQAIKSDAARSRVAEAEDQAREDKGFLDGVKEEVRESGATTTSELNELSQTVQSPGRER